MATIREYLPPFMLDGEAHIVEFNTQEELLDIPFVKKFSVDDTGKKDSHFQRYILMENMLMVEVEGERVYAVGTLSDVSMLTLPKRDEE